MEKRAKANFEHQRRLCLLALKLASDPLAAKVYLDIERSEKGKE
jgi:hypothetical protein